MAHIDKGALTRLEIVEEASKQFLDKGYSNTTMSSLAKELQMSTGNLTFHYPTKEHLLAELVNMLCKFQWNRMEEAADDGISSVLAVCLELTAMAAACEEDEVIKDLLISSYTSALCLDVIRRNDTKRAKAVFRSYRTDWTDEQFCEAEILVSGIEYSTLMTGGEPVPLETRVSGALQVILGMYGVPPEMREIKLQKVFAMDYRQLGAKTFREFKKFVNRSNNKAIMDLMKR